MSSLSHSDRHSKPKHANSSPRFSDKPKSPRSPVLASYPPPVASPPFSWSEYDYDTISPDALTFPQPLQYYEPGFPAYSSMPMPMVYVETPPLPVAAEKDQPTTSNKGKVTTLNRNTSTVRRVKLTKEGYLKLYSPIAPRLLQDLPEEHRAIDVFNKLCYTAITCEPDGFKQQGYRMRFKGNVELFIAVTMYNENPYLLSRTLYGIMQNLKDLNKRWSPNGWSNVVVCIVADGRKEINQQCLDVLTTIGIFQEGLMKLQVEDRPTQAHLFECATQLAVDSKGDIYSHQNGIVPCQLMFCLKEKNKKKINSHRWIFEAFAPLLDPKVCILLDVGTKPSDDSFFRFWSAFEADPEVGGACGEIGVVKGFGWWQLLFNPLVASQHFEYKMSNILDKPTESVFGYIAVLPGAFSAYRWAALQNDSKGNGPLTAYFQGEREGGRPGGLFESNMYLAEDRILCFELVAKRKQNWLLRYVKSAYGETDVPRTPSEFMLQRRRWLNGSFFAALYACSHWYRILFADHGFFRTLAFMIQFIFVFINLIFSWFMLGNFYLSFLFISTTMTSPGIDPFGGHGPLVTQILQYIYLATLLTTLITSLGNRPQGATFIFVLAMFIFALLMAYTTFASAYLCYRSFLYLSAEYDASKNPQSGLLFSNPTFVDIVLSVGVTLGLYLLSSLIYGLPLHLFTSFIQYFLLIPSYTNVLNIYAFCNIHDITWGTKRQDGASRIQDIAAKIKDDKDASVVMVSLPMGVEEIDQSYKDARKNIGSSASGEKLTENKANDGQMREDYYRRIRTYIILLWLFSNMGLVVLVSLLFPLSLAPGKSASANMQMASLLNSTDDASVAAVNGTFTNAPPPTALLPKEPVYQRNIYFSVILWSMAGITAFKFFGSTIYRVESLFKKGR